MKLFAANYVPVALQLLLFPLLTNLWGAQDYAHYITIGFVCILLSTIGVFKLDSLILYENFSLKKALVIATFSTLLLSSFYGLFYSDMVFIYIALSLSLTYQSLFTAYALKAGMLNAYLLIRLASPLLILVIVFIVEKWLLTVVAVNTIIIILCILFFFFVYLPHEDEKLEMNIADILKLNSRFYIYQSRHVLFDKFLTIKQIGDYSAGIITYKLLSVIFESSSNWLSDKYYSQISSRSYIIRFVILVSLFTMAVSTIATFEVSFLERTISLNFSLLRVVLFFALANFFGNILSQHKHYWYALCLSTLFIFVGLLWF